MDTSYDWIKTLKKDDIVIIDNDVGFRHIMYKGKVDTINKKTLNVISLREGNDLGTFNLSDGSSYGSRSWSRNSTNILNPLDPKVKDSYERYCYIKRIKKLETYLSNLEALTTEQLETVFEKSEELQELLTPIKDSNDATVQKESNT